MAIPQTPVPVGADTGYHPTLQDASTQTVCLNLLNTRDASTQTAEESISQKTTQDASTQTPIEDLSVIEQLPAALETSDESRKRRISKVQETTHGSDFVKLPRNETCRMGEEFDSNVNVLPVYSDIKKIINIQENVASDKTSSKKDNAPRQKSDAEASKVKDVCSLDDTLAIAVPSHCLEQESPSKSGVEKLERESLIKQQPSQTEQKQSICLACKQTISKHVGEHNYIYKCCRCEFENRSYDYLQIHVYNEHAKTLKFSVCQIYYSDMKSHVSGGPCVLCECDTNFGCIYELEEHYISEHKEFIETKCFLCKKTIEEHLNDDVVSYKYQCCVTDCIKREPSISKLNSHLSSHAPLKLQKCEICECHFKHLAHHQKNHPLCTSCKKRFINIYFLNVHLCEKRKEE